MIVAFTKGLPRKGEEVVLVGDEGVLVHHRFQIHAGSRSDDVAVIGFHAFGAAVAAQPSPRTCDTPLPVEAILTVIAQPGRIHSNNEVVEIGPESAVNPTFEVLRKVCSQAYTCHR